MNWRTHRSRFTKNLLKNSKIKTVPRDKQKLKDQNSFLGIEIIYSSKQFSDEFDTRLELLKIVYKI
jgi:hypothetical protein